MQGKIARLIRDKGFGFIRTDDSHDNDYFFHRSACKNFDFETLEEGDTVEFEGHDGDKGPRAEDIYL